MSINIERVVVALNFATSATTAVEHNLETGSYGVGYKGSPQGWVKTIKMKMPTFASATPSGTFYILDEDGDALYTSAAIEQGTTTVVTGAEVPLAGGEIVKVTLGAIPSGDAAIDEDATVVLTVVL